MAERGEQKERVFSKPIACGHCGNFAPHERLATARVDNPYANGFWGFDRYYIYLCPACERVRLAVVFDSPADEPDKEEQLYPPARIRVGGLPPDISRALLAAEKVRKIDSNAFGVLLRRVLELVCIDRGADGPSLNDQLADLARKDEIPKKLVKVAASLRQLGNVGAHASLGDLRDQDVPVLDALCQAILDYVYTAPHLAQLAEGLMEARRPNRREDAEL